MDRDAERELVSRLRAGDADAFDAVYAEYNTRLFAFLARLSRNRATAEDLLEETWLRLVSHAERLREDSQLGAWLFTVARNLYVSYCRSRMLEDVHAPDFIGLWPSGCPSSPFEETAGHELGVRLKRRLRNCHSSIERRSCSSRSKDSHHPRPHRSVGSAGKPCVSV